MFRLGFYGTVSGFRLEFWACSLESKRGLVEAFLGLRMFLVFIGFFCFLFEVFLV